MLMLSGTSALPPFHSSGTGMALLDTVAACNLYIRGSYQTSELTAFIDLKSIIIEGVRARVGQPSIYNSCRFSFK